MYKTNESFKKDDFLTKIVGFNCFNVSKLSSQTKFEKKGFYSYIFPYSKKNINTCQKLDFKYISSRVIFKHDKKIPKKSISKIEYKITFNNKDLTINDFREIIGVLSKTSRFYKDNNIRKYAKKIYKKWIYNSLFNRYADKLIIVKSRNNVIGFVSLKIFQTDCIIDLIGVDEKYQNQGIGSYLLRKVIDQFKQHNIYVGTEVENIQALNFYLKNNFKIYQYKLIFHKHT